MLCQFTVRNYACIKDEVTLDLQATNISEHMGSLLKDIDGESFLPLSVIYGPNGAGKSTVLFSIYSLACKVMRPICAVSCNNKECMRSVDQAMIRPYRFSREAISSPTEYELFFRTAQYEYQYQISILKDKIMSETMYKKKLIGSRYSLLFSRKGTTNIKLTGSLKNYQVADISEDLTLLSYLGITHRRNAIIKDIINWFDNQFYFLNYSSPSEDARIPVTESSAVKSLLIKMLSEMDIDISDYRVERTEEKMKVYTTHSVNGRNYELDLTEESNGTIKIFGLLPIIAEALLEGTTLVIDELDAKIHPVLLKYIIGLFTDPNKNKNKAQLLFTSHDLSTMNREVFRRDEIWFVAKDENQATNLYSLVEFKDDEGKSVRKDESYHKRYLEGRYGADPYLRRIIDWGELS